ncbi:MAG TPA: hypothetical protein VMJ32_12900 [Pirellulales bacterium]|nr:hypothetical protein [Pirellulales bacterium]
MTYTTEQLSQIRQLQNAINTFERAKLEIHPDNRSEYDRLLANLRRQLKELQTGMSIIYEGGGAESFRITLSPQG